MLNYLSQRPGVSLALSLAGIALLVTGIATYPVKGSSTAQAYVCDASFPAEITIDRSKGETWKTHWKLTKWLAFHDQGRGTDIPVGAAEWGVYGRMYDEATNTERCFTEKWTVSSAMLGSTRHPSRGKTWSGLNLTDKGGDQIRVMPANFTITATDKAFSSTTNDEWMSTGLYGVSRELNKGVPDGRVLIPVEWIVTGTM